LGEGVAEMRGDPVTGECGCDPLILESERVANLDSYVLVIHDEHSPRHPMVVRIQWDHGTPADELALSLRAAVVGISNDFGLNDAPPRS